MTALRFVNTSFMQLDGVVVEGARQRGIHILASKNISLRNLTVRNVGSMGVHVERGWNVTLADSTVEHTGGTAVDVNQAGTPAQTPWTSTDPIPNLQGTANDGQVRTLTPGGNAVLGNTLRFFGRICHAYRPGGMSNGTAVTIAGNEIAFGPHAGMLPSGNDNLIERNAFHHLVMQVWFSQLIPPVLSLFTGFRPYLAHFFPVFPRCLRVFTVSTRRFRRAPSRNPGPRNSRQEGQEGRTPPLRSTPQTQWEGSPASSARTRHF